MRRALDHHQPACRDGEETVKRAIACSLFLILPATVTGAELGRLFFTPAERAQLDGARTQKKAPPPPTATQPIEASAPEIVNYGGIVRRSDGKALLWINNRVAEEKAALGALSLKGAVRPDGAVTLQVPQSGGTIAVKVGQSVDLQSGRVAEGHKMPASKPHSSEPQTEDAEEKVAASTKNASTEKAYDERTQDLAASAKKERLNASAAKGR
jgi:hypothetical protein